MVQAPGAAVMRPWDPSPLWVPPTSPPGLSLYTLAVVCAPGGGCESVDDLAVAYRRAPRLGQPEQPTAEGRALGQEVLLVADADKVTKVTEIRLAKSVSSVDLLSTIRTPRILAIGRALTMLT